MFQLLRNLLILVSLVVLTSWSMAADDDISTMLNKWASAESRLKAEIEKGNVVDEKVLDVRRKKLTLKISQQIFVYAQNFKLRELKKLCEEIVDVKDDIPYLKDKKLMSFAKDFIRWHEGFKVRVTASVESFKVGIGLQPIPWVGKPRCKRIDVKFSKLKPSNVSSWNEGNPAQTIITSPNDKAEYLVGLQSIFYAQDDSVKSARFYFSPARDTVEEKTVSNFGVGYSIKYKFDVSSLAENRFPVRLVDFLNRYGKTAEALCEEDND